MNSNKVFDYAFNVLLRWEGGYVNDPADPGGETKYGISKRAYPDVDIKNLTIEGAKLIYYDDYWVRARCHLLPSRWAIYHFDTAVNVGPKRAVLLLQRAVGVYPDGVLGNKTLDAVRKACLSSYVVERNSFYVNLAYNRPSLRKFLIGWLRRSIDVYKRALAYR